MPAAPRRIRRRQAGGREDQGAEPVTVETKLIGEKLDEQKDREYHCTGGNERLQEFGNANRASEEERPADNERHKKRTRPGHFHFGCTKHRTERGQGEGGSLLGNGGKA